MLRARSRARLCARKSEFVAESKAMPVTRKKENARDRRGYSEKEKNRSRKKETGRPPQSPLVALAARPSSLDDARRISRMPRNGESRSVPSGCRCCPCAANRRLNGITGTTSTTCVASESLAHHVYSHHGRASTTHAESAEYRRVGIVETLNAGTEHMRKKIVL
ncbi:uncharacterized protein LOC113005570 [Solenopsis invicta]|uniref:uncharacterized protein LOC113005570 n=1 Tax=Solenopsis invicta TaxID=13686 RepID=UPI00193CE38F|nr:uncharacterized protein LOC113005570 [Solenopsis invicta]